MKNLMILLAILVVFGKANAQSGNDLDSAFGAAANDSAGAVAGEAVGAGADAAQTAAAAADAPAALTYTSLTGIGILPKSQASIQSCEAASQSAKTACLASLSPKLQGAAALISSLLGTIGMTKSTSETCSKYNNAMKIAETALLAYNTMCTAMQASCESACGATKADLASDGTMFTSHITAWTAKLVGPMALAAKDQIAKLTADQGSLGTATAAIGKKLVVCQGYKWNLAAAGIGLTNVLKQSAASKTCANATTVADCSKTPYDPSCAKQMDCGKAENYQQATCICQRNPTAAGCAGYSASLAGLPSMSGNMPSGQSPDKPGMPTGGGTDSIPVNVGGTNVGGGGPAGFGGGGGGLGGGGMGADGTGQKGGGVDGAKKEKGLNANILGGYDGGGGGGAGGSRSSASVPDSAYKAYLPGGAKDPGSSAKVFGNGQVTGSGSKSNWEKVSERYSEARASLVRP